MNIAEAIAFCALVIGVISGAGIWLDAYKRRLTNREKELELQARIAEGRHRDTRSEVGEIEQRLRVLERIATDKGNLLSEEIEGLRGLREKVQ